MAMVAMLSTLEVLLEACRDSPPLCARVALPWYATLTKVFELEELLEFVEEALQVLEHIACVRERAATPHAGSH